MTKPKTEDVLATRPARAGAASLASTRISYFGSDGEPPLSHGLKVSRALAATVPRTRRSWLLVLKSSLALRACALGLEVAGPTSQLDVANRSVRTEMPRDREVVHSANGG
jgi:hypothetical protein